MENTEIKEEIKRLKTKSSLISKIEKNEAEITKLEKALTKAREKQEALLYEFKTGQKLEKSKGKNENEKQGGDDE